MISIKEKLAAFGFLPLGRYIIGRDEAGAPCAFRYTFYNIKQNAKINFEGTCSDGCPHIGSWRIEIGRIVGKTYSDLDLLLTQLPVGWTENGQISAAGYLVDTVLRHISEARAAYVARLA